MRPLLANKKIMCVVATLLVANAAPITMAWAGELQASKAAASAASPQINPQQKQDKEISRTARAFVQYIFADRNMDAALKLTQLPFYVLGESLHDEKSIELFISGSISLSKKWEIAQIDIFSQKNDPAEKITDRIQTILGQIPANDDVSIIYIGLTTLDKPPKTPWRENITLFAKKENEGTKIIGFLKKY